MADSPEKRDDDAEQEVEAQFIEPEISMFLLGFGWFAIKAMAQAVMGWLGIQLFKKVWDKIARLWRKDKDGQNKGTPSEISEEESAAASSRSLSG